MTRTKKKGVVRPTELTGEFFPVGQAVGVVAGNGTVYVPVQTGILPGDKVEIRWDGKNTIAFTLIEKD